MNRYSGLLSFLLVSCSPAITPQTVTSHPYEAQMIDLVNEARARGRSCGSAGIFSPAPPLSSNTQLGRAARRHSQDMWARGGAGSHLGSDGSRPRERARREGYNGARVGENIYWNFIADPRPQTALEFWLSSPPHCRNLMNPEFTELGAAKVGGYWTLVLAQR